MYFFFIFLDRKGNLEADLFIETQAEATTPTYFPVTKVVVDSAPIEATHL